jgi:hypothetical protein
MSEWGSSPSFRFFFCLVVSYTWRAPSALCVAEKIENPESAAKKTCTLKRENPSKHVYKRETCTHTHACISIHQFRVRDASTLYRYHKPSKGRTAHGNPVGHEIWPTHTRKT